MIRGPIAVVLLVAVAGASSCKCKKDSPSATPEVASAKDAGAKPRIPPATEPDPGYEARRDELLRRGDPDMMKPAPVVDVNKPPDEAVAADLIKSVSKDVMMVDQIRVDLAARRLEIPGKIALRDGVLEYIAVGAAGKAYESLLTVDASAIELRLSLTLLGLEGKTDETLGVAVRLPRGGKDVEVPLEELLVDRKTGKPAPPIRFRVIGFDDAEKAQALATEQLVSLVGHEPHAPLRVVGDLGNPYAGPDQGIGLDPKAVPEVGTAVTLILIAR